MLGVPPEERQVLSVDLASYKDRSKELSELVSELLG
jgi:hypothetical protein